uniref:Uncharacterized protein n=1 Tax=viral metagenome TaxID=1070528 RepID=A0A6C0KUY0_9ZZZZ
MKLSFSLSVLVLFSIVLIFWSSGVDPQAHSIEPFALQKMRPWFGYEPGYGPGWGRSGCCDQAVPKNMGNA